MSKSTHLTALSVEHSLRLGGLKGSLKGAQPVWPGLVPTNWYPQNLPAATNGTPTNADCQNLLNALAPLVARLTIQQSLMLGLVYRTVQPGVVPSGDGSTFTVNGATATGISSQFDRANAPCESVAVDVVNKNPSLLFDLAIRLATQTAIQIDQTLLGNLYSGFSNAAVGTAQTTPTGSTLASAVTALAGTAGEPLFGVFAPGVLSAAATAGDATVEPPLGSPGRALCSLWTTGIGTSSVRLVRLFSSVFVPVTGVATQTQHNQLFTPSAMAYATTDLGTTLGYQAGVSYTPPTGVILTATSTHNDPETATPQLCLQLVIGNTGAGAQAVYVNYLGAPVLVNPSHGIVIQS